MPKHLFLLSEVRSGSTYVAELIAYNFAKRFGIELWDLTLEKFQGVNDLSTADDVAMMLDAITATADGYRAFMVKCGQFSSINQAIEGDQALTEAFFGPQAYCIIIRRREIIGQAVSLNCALCSGKYHSYADEPRCVPCVGTNDGINRALKMIALSGAYLEACTARFHNVLVVDYEEIMADEAGFLNRVAQFVLGRDGRFDRVATLERPKLMPAHRPQKAVLRAQFVEWLVRNHHDTG
jgi:LPS sulfotransferase NodH